MAGDRREDLSGDLPREQDQNAAGSAGGRQMGGDPEEGDMRAGGGSSGSGGYGEAQNQQLHQGQEGGTLSGRQSDPGLGRGAAFDEQQGGGRGADSVSADDELAEDQARHQDRGQSVAAEESDRD